MDGRIFPGPFFLEGIKLDSGLIGGHGPVNRAQIDRNGLAILPGAEVQGVTHPLPDNACSHA